VTHNYY